MSSLEDDLLFAKNHTYVVHMEQMIVQSMYKYLNPLFLLCGSIGNLMSLIIMHKMSIHVWSSCIYLTVLAMVDLIILYMDCGNNWYKQLTKVDLSVTIMTSSDAMCRVYLFFYNFIFHFASWLVVAITGECLVSIKHPVFKYKSCTREHARAVILLLAVLLIGINIHYFWTHGIVTMRGNPHPQGQVCIYVNEFSDIFRDQIWQYLDILIKDIIPVLVICLLVIIMTMVLNTSAHHSKTMEPVLKKYYMDIESFQELRHVVIAVAVVFMICTLPRVGVAVFRHCVTTYGVMTYTQSLSAKLMLADAVCKMLSYANHSLKLFVYIFFCRRINHWTKKSTKVFLSQSCSMNKAHRTDSYYPQKVAEKPSAPSHSFIESNSVQMMDPRIHINHHRDPYRKPRVFTQTQVWIKYIRESKGENMLYYILMS